MADPKYANLPGIAYDQADVYETTDLPESEQLPVFSKEENDSVEILHCSSNEAFNKFKDKYVLSKNVDFSDRVSQKSRTGYHIGCGEWEVHGGKEKETPFQKFERLQCEFKELIAEINNLKEQVKNDKDSEHTVDVILQLEKVGRELDGLKLHESLGTELMESLSDPQGSNIKQLMSQIELFKQFKNLNNDDKLTTSTLKESNENSGILKYQMMYLPEKAKLQEMARIGQLEQRLGILENIIGSKSKKFLTFQQSLKCQGVLEAVQQLGAKSSLLDSTQLDIVESRLSILLSRMDNIAQKKSVVSHDSEQEQKISEMYEIIKKVEAMSPILPQTINRLTILNTIHQQAAEFSKSLGQLEELQRQISLGLDNNKFLLKGVQDSFTSNLNLIHQNISSLDQRIKKFEK